MQSFIERTMAGEHRLVQQKFSNEIFNVNRIPENSQLKRTLF